MRTSITTAVALSALVARARSPACAQAGRQLRPAEFLPGWSLPAAACASSNAHPPRVLVIDDEGPTRELVTLYLESRGLEVANVRSTDGARLLVERGQFDLVILDWTLTAAQGAELVHLSKARHPDIPVVVFTRAELSADGVGGEVDAIVRKGTSLETLSGAIVQALGRRQTRSQSAA